MKSTIDMAREAELFEKYQVFYATLPELKAFEALVRADERSVEREACAKACVKVALEFKRMYCGDEMEAALRCEKTIRARGQRSDEDSKRGETK